MDFTPNMTECDNVTVASNVTSCFNGGDEIEIVELRQIRNVIIKDRKRLIDEYARIRQLEEDEFDIEAPDHDLFRLRWLKNVVEYVRYARELFENGRITRETLDAAASALDKMTECWNKTAYVTKGNPNHALRMPTKDDMLKPFPQTGEKRNSSDYSIATGTLSLFPPAKGPFPRTSSPNPPPNLQLVDEMVLQPQPTTPQNNDARDPSVQRWVNDNNAATPTNAAPQVPASNAAGSAARRRLLEASRARKEAEECRKERDNLRQVVAQSEELHQKQVAEAVAAAIAKTKTEVTAAANAAYEREMQKQAEKEKEKGERSQHALENARATIANAQAVANQAREQASKSNQDLENARMKIQMQNNDLQHQERLREEAQARANAMEKELREALQKAKEKARKAEQNANAYQSQLRDKEDELEKERSAVTKQKQATDAHNVMLPSCTPANEHTPPRRKSPAQQQQRQHPFHENLSSRQQQSSRAEKHVHFQSEPHSSNNDVICLNADETLDNNNSKSDYTSVQRTKTNVTYEYGDTFIRCKQMHMDQMRGARPSTPFSTGSPTEYSIHMNAFEHATRYPTINDEDRMDEIIHWFSGEAEKVVRLHQLNPNHEEGFRDVKAELDALFRETQDSFGTTIRAITRGKPLNSQSHSEHLKLYTELREAQSVVMRAGTRAAGYEFDRRDIIRDILNARLPHMADRFWREDRKSMNERKRPWAFNDLLAELKDWLGILRSKDPESFEATHLKKSSIAAVTAAPKQPTPQTYASRLVNSPPKVQPTATCNECGGLHETSLCNVLIAMTVEQRLEALTKRGLCYHCLNPGHRASSCTQRPICGKCNRRHATLLHDRKFDSPKKKTNVSASALPFRPFTGSEQPSQRTAPSATSGNASTQQESVL